MMTYLLIAFVLAVIWSPVMWLRQTPRQKLITAMRQLALSKGIRVKLSKPADAREGEGRLEYVTYSLPWHPDSRPSSAPRMEKWLLVKFSSRYGAPSPWLDWQWLGRECNDSLMPSLESVLPELPKDICAVESNISGIFVYWQERGEIADVSRLFTQLDFLRKAIRN